MVRFIFILLFSGVWVSSIAQNEKLCQLSVSGAVIDEHDHSALSYATIYLIEPNQGVVADSAGKFEIRQLCEGEYTLVVSHVSCQPDTMLLQLDENTVLNLRLEHHPEVLQQVTIVGQGIRKRTNSDQERIMDLSTLEQYSQGNLADALTELPGISSLKTGNSIVKPVIQGLYGSRIITVNHGVRMQDMEWGDEHGTMIDINSAGKIRVINGGSALRYGGDAVAGLILVEPVAIPEDTLTGRTILGGATNGRGGVLSSEVSLSGSTGWFTKLQGTVKRFGDFRTPDYQLTNTGVFDKGGSIMAGHRSEKGGFDVYYSIFDNEVGILSASHLGSVGDLVEAINSGEPQIIEDFSYTIGLPRQEVTHHLGRMQWTRNTGIGKIDLQYDFQYNHRFEFDKRIGDDQDKPSIDLELTTHTFSSNLSYNQSRNLPLESGLMYRYQKNFANPETGIRRLVPDYDKYELASYISGRYQLRDKLLTDFGIRYDFIRIDALKFYRKSRWEERNYQQDFSDFIIREFPTQILTNPKFDYHNLTYALGFNYRVKPQVEYRFNYSYAQRAPNPSELFSDGLHHGAARIELGDLRIDQEKTHKLGITLDGKSDRLEWDLAAYLNLVKNFVVLEPTGVEHTIRGAFPVWEFYQTDARIWGVDGLLTANWSSHWYSNHRARYINGQDTKGSRPLINIPAPQVRNSLSFEQSNWKFLQITLESEYTFRQNRYPNNNFLVFVPGSDSSEELDISTPPDGYHLLNFQASARFEIFNPAILKLGIGIRNMTNTRYRDYLNRLRYFADDLGRSFEVNMTLNF